MVLIADDDGDVIHLYHYFCEIESRERGIFDWDVMIWLGHLTGSWSMCTIEIGEKQTKHRNIIEQFNWNLTTILLKGRGS